MFELENLKTNSVVVVAGPTASGKSGLALDLAKRYNGVVINADSMQIYKGTPIISAAPTAEDKAQVEHLLYEIFEPSEKGSVAEWLLLAVEAIRKCWQEKKLPIVVGGTGFYIESLVKGGSPIPETSEQVKEAVGDLFDKGGTAEIYRCLLKEDPKGAAMVKPADTTRVRRALEIFRDTGKSIDDWFKEPLISPLPEADFRIVALLPDLKCLEEKCSLRFDLMMANGAEAEVRYLLNLGLDNRLPAMKAIGVPELKDYIEGRVSKDEAVTMAKLHTRQYAKRQLTWFRNRLKHLPAEVSIVDLF